MSTYTQLLYQLVFSTRNRKPVLLKENRYLLYKYIWGILNRRRCRVYRINGVEDHIHIVTHIHPSVAIASLMKDIKLSSGRFIREHNLFDGFDGWQEGYGAFSYCHTARRNLVDYVKNQEQHHKTRTFAEEFRELLREHSVEVDERFLL